MVRLLLFKKKLLRGSEHSKRKRGGRNGGNFAIPVYT